MNFMFSYNIFVLFLCCTLDDRVLILIIKGRNSKDTNEAQFPFDIQALEKQELLKLCTVQLWTVCFGILLSIISQKEEKQ